MRRWQQAVVSNRVVIGVPNRSSSSMQSEQRAKGRGELGAGVVSDSGEIGKTLATSGERKELAFGFNWETEGFEGLMGVRERVLGCFVWVTTSMRRNGVLLS